MCTAQIKTYPVKLVQNVEFAWQAGIRAVFARLRKTMQMSPNKEGKFARKINHRDIFVFIVDFDMCYILDIKARKQTTLHIFKAYKMASSFSHSTSSSVMGLILGDPEVSANLYCNSRTSVL